MSGSKLEQWQFRLSDLLALIFIAAVGSLAFRKLGAPATGMYFGLYLGGLAGYVISPRWYSVVGCACTGAFFGGLIGIVSDYVQ